MKLYIFYQNGIVKIGITKHEDSHVRLKQINSTLPEENKLQLICEFEVNQNPAMIERLIHEYLGINQLNIQYLKNEMVLVDVDYLHSKQDGSSEFFLADKDKIKQAITLFGILGYIDVSPEQLKAINQIKGYSFDYFAGKHSEFLKLCEPVIKNSKYHKNTNKDTLASLMEELKDTQIIADFCIENNQFYLMLNDKKISIEELTEPNNINIINEFLSNKDNMVINKKDGQILYSIIRELRDNNKKTSVQPLTTMQKELKTADFHRFMDEIGYALVKKIMSQWNDCDGIIPYELLKEESNIIPLILQAIKNNSIEDEDNHVKIYQKEIKILENTNLFIPNFNSPILFPDYYGFLKKSKFLQDCDDIYYDVTLQNSKIITAIYKILYDSKNKEEELIHIDNFIKNVEDFYRSIDNREMYIKNATQPLSTNILENLVKNSIKNNEYIDLAEACISAYGDTKSEKTAINKIKLKLK